MRVRLIAATGARIPAAMRRLALAAILLALAAPAPTRAQSAPPVPSASLDAIAAEAQDLEQLHALIVLEDGVPLLERRLRGPDLDTPVNIKSASKVIVSALVGRAIAEGLLTGIDQLVAPLLARDLPDAPDPRLATVTLGNLLSMQAGLEPTSGPRYGAWIASGNWVRFALARPFVDDPGGGMLYSTGNSHLLSAILTRVSGRPTRQLFAEWLGKPLGIRAGGWERDPQGVDLGGNNMALSPRALARFGEMMRRGGTWEGQEVLSPAWIAASWTPRTRSIHSGDRYGFGWFMRMMGGHQVWYAWGFGGQMLYIVPDLALTVVITSDDTPPAARTGYIARLHRLVEGSIIPAVSEPAATPAPASAGPSPALATPVQAPLR